MSCAERPFFYFNSHPREGGDEAATIGGARQIISIPTPARGVTAKMHIYSVKNLAFSPYFLRSASKNFFFIFALRKIFHTFVFLILRRSASKSRMTAIGAVIG